MKPTTKKRTMTSRQRTIVQKVAESNVSPHSARAYALLAVDSGMTQAAAAEKFGLTRDIVKYWLMKFRANGTAVFPSDTKQGTATSSSAETSKTAKPKPTSPKPAREAPQKEKEASTTIEAKNSKSEDKTGKMKKGKKSKKKKDTKKEKKGKKGKSKKKEKKLKKEKGKSKGKKNKKKGKKNKKKK